MLKNLFLFGRHAGSATTVRAAIILVGIAVTVISACGGPDDITDPGKSVGWSGVPPAITDFTATPISDTKMDLTWTDAEGETEYGIEWAPVADGYAEAERRTLFADTTAYSAVNLTAGVEYAFRLRASNADGATAWVEVFEIADAALWTLVGTEGFTFGAWNYRVARGSDGTIGVTYTDGGPGSYEVTYYDETAEAWTVLTTVAPGFDYYDTEIGNASTLGTDIIFTTSRVGTLQTLEYFDDGGGGWNAIGAGLPNGTGINRPVDLEIYVTAGGVNYAVQSFPVDGTDYPVAYQLNLDSPDLLTTETWQQLGGATAPTTPTDTTRLAVDEVDGRVALGYEPEDGVSGYRTPAVSVFNGTSWTDLGVPPFYDTDNYDLEDFDVGFNADGHVMVVCSPYDTATSSDVSAIYEYDGSTWTDHGGLGDGVDDIVLERDPDGVLYVAYRRHDRITVKRWDGGRFAATGVVGKRGGQIDLDVSGVPTIVFHDYDHDGPTVYELD